MSTDDQQYSIANQSAKIRDYAKAHDIEIVRSFADRGKSGLRLKKRTGLQDLLTIVRAGEADFTLLLVYDVSRWGRFQDADESAFYEYTLKLAGVSVIYCAEPFGQMSNPSDAMVKALKRAMAAEYSRELSEKVSQGQRRIAQLGYRLGGVAGFGLRRVAIDPAGSRRIVLQDGERKAIQTDRIVLEHGPREEVGAVRKMFDLFVTQGWRETRIAEYLNTRKIATRSGSQWQRKTVVDILSNPKYAGDLVINRTTTKMGTVPVKTPPEDWIRVANCYPAIVSRSIWNAAQEILRQRSKDSREDELLAKLRKLLSEYGWLSSSLIDSEQGVPSSQTYRKHFGSLRNAYARIGYKSARATPNPSAEQVRLSRLQIHETIEKRLMSIAETVRRHPKIPLWTIDECFTIYANVLVTAKRKKRRLVWTFGRSFDHHIRVSCDVLILARVSTDGPGVLDYYVFPGRTARPIKIFEQNPWWVDLHRFEDLEFLTMLCGRTSLSDFEEKR